MTWRAGRTGLMRSAPIAAVGGTAMWATAAGVEPFTRPTDAEFAIVTATWWALGAMLVWLTASVFVVVATSESGVKHRLARFAMPGSRTIAQAMLAVGVLAASACSPDIDHAPTLHAVDAPLGEVPDTPPTPPTPPISIPADEPRVQIDLTPPVPRNERPPLEMGIDPNPPVQASTYEVLDGDNLWDIATRQLESLNPNASTTEIADYWRLLIATNETTLWSGEPNLIHPGEVLTLP